MFRAEDIDILRDIPPNLRPPFIYVAGHLKNDGTDTFVIHVAESLPPPSTPLPQEWPIRVIATRQDETYIPMIAGPVFGPMLDANRTIEFAGIPEVSYESPPRGLMSWRVVFRPTRGRPKGKGTRFKDAEDFHQTVITDLRNLRQHGHDDSQLELARLWYQRDSDPAAEVDSLVTEIKRYCKQYKRRWKDLVEESRRG
jgi:hypothetical protein